MDSAFVSAAATIIGVVVGLLGGEGIRWFRERRSIKRRKKVIICELKAAGKQIETIEQAISFCSTQLSQGVRPKGTISLLMAVGYDRYFPEVYEHYSARERECLVFIYGELFDIRDALNAFPDDVDEQLIKFRTRGTYDKNEEYCRRLMSIRLRVENVKNTLGLFLINDIEACHRTLHN
jgi:hypothetical protein